MGTARAQAPPEKHDPPAKAGGKAAPESKSGTAANAAAQETPAAGARSATPSPAAGSARTGAAPAAAAGPGKQPAQATAPTPAQRFDRLALRAKLQVSEPGDAVEQEADAVAERVMRAPAPGQDDKPPPQADKAAAGREPEAVKRSPAREVAEPQRNPPPSPEATQVERPPPKAEPLGRGETGRQAAAEKDIKRAARDPAAPATPVADEPASTEAMVARLGEGRPLDATVRAWFEPRLGRDLSAVRVHTDEAAVEAARSLAARAFTFGRHIAFGAGEYQPDSESGRRLIAHELAHVLQNDDAAVGGVVRRKPDPRYKDANDIGEGAIDPAKHATARSTLETLRLPAIKSRHAPLYVSAAASKKLKRPKGYDRSKPEFSTKQTDNWNAAIDLSAHYAKIGFDPAQPKVSLTFFGAGGKALEGKPGEVLDYLKIPCWTPDGSWLGAKMQVDHMLEVQLGGADAMGNYELLTGKHNTNVGSLLRAEIYANVKNYLAKVDKNNGDGLVKEYLKTYDIVFTSVTPGGEGKNLEATSQFWSEKQIKGAEHFTWLKDETRAAKDDGNDKSRFAVFSPTGNALVDAFALVGGKTVVVTDTGRLAGIRITKIALNPGFDAAGSGNIGTLSGEWRLPSAVAVTGDKTLSIGLNKLGDRKYAGALASLPTSVEAQIEGASPVKFDAISLVRGKVVADGKLKPTLKLIDGIEIPVRWRGNDVAFGFTFSSGQLKDKLPVPGLTIEEASLSLYFANNQLGADGTVQFSVANFGDGSLRASMKPGAKGPVFGMRGSMSADRTLFDQATIEVWYDNEKGFGGKGTLAITQPGRITGIKAARVQASYDAGAFSATGGVEPDLPGVKKASLGVTYAGNTLAIKGNVSLDAGIPGIGGGDVTVEVKKSGGKAWKVSASGEVTPSFGGISGFMLKASYDDGLFKLGAEKEFKYKVITGKVMLGVTNEAVDAAGKPSGAAAGKTLRVYGHGELEGKFAEWLILKVGARIDPKGDLWLKGGVELPTKEVFKRWPDKPRKNWVTVSTGDIPIVGVGIGPLTAGITASISGALDTEAWVGPGTLSGVNVSFDEMRPGKNDPLKLQGGAKFAVPGYAGAVLSVTGDVALKAGVKLAGELKVEAKGGLDLGLKADFSAAWSETGGVQLDAKGSIEGQAKLTFSVTGGFSVKVDAIVAEYELWSKYWELAKFEYGAPLFDAAEASMSYSDKEGVKFDASGLLKAPPVTEVGYYKKLLDGGVSDETLTDFDGNEYDTCDLPPEPEECVDEPVDYCDDPDAADPVCRVALDPLPPAPDPELAAQGTEARVDERMLKRLGEGTAMPDELRADFERRFGADLGHVRFHVGPRATAAADALRARAFSFGPHVVFGAGAYRPESDEGRRLIAHELAHVRQHDDDRAADVVARKADPRWKDPDDIDDGGFEPALERRARPALQTLRLPAIKARHAHLYRREAGRKRLVRPAGYDRRVDPFKTRQESNWKDAIDLSAHYDEVGYEPDGGEQSLPFFGARKRAIKGSAGEVLERLKIPYWGPDGVWLDEGMQVDHMVEAQFGGADDMSNYELLSGAQNTNVGSLFRAEIYENVRAFLVATGKNAGRKAVTRYLDSHDVAFTRIEAGREGKNLERATRFWSAADIRAGRHLSWLRDEKRSKADDGRNRHRFALFSPTGNALVQAFPLAGHRVSVRDQRRLAGIAIQSIKLDRDFGDADPGAAIGLLTGRWELPRTVRTRAKNEIEIPLLKLRDLRYAAALGSLPGALETDVEGASPIVFQGFEFARGKLSAAGILTPTLPLMRGIAIPVEWLGDEIRFAYTFRADALAQRLAVPGLAIDEATLTLFFAGGELGVEGGIGFTVAGFASGHLAARMRGGPRGPVFEMRGGMQADRRLFDKADIALSYSSEEGLGGEGLLAITEPGRIRGIRSARVQAAYHAGRFEAQGGVEPDIPGLKAAELAVAYDRDHLAIAGRVALADGLPVVSGGAVAVSVARRGEDWKVAAAGRLPINLPGLHADVEASYDEGIFSIGGGADFTAGMVKGRVEAGLTNRPLTEDGRPGGGTGETTLRGYGYGRVTVRPLDWLEGTAAFRVTPEGSVRVSGELALAKTLTVFPPYPAKPWSKTLLPVPEIDIPLFGIPVVDIGLFAHVGGELKATAQVGPGELSNVRLGIEEFDPANPDSLHLKGGALFSVKGRAGVEGDLDAGLKLGAPLVSLTGTLGIGAGLGVDIGGSLDTAVEWTARDGMQLGATLRAFASPRLTLSAKGKYKVTAGVWRLRKTLLSGTWTIGEAELGPDFTIAATVPIGWSSRAGVDFDFSKIDFEAPDIDITDIVVDLLT